MTAATQAEALAQTETENKAGSEAGSEWIVLMTVGIFLGGLVSGFVGRRIKRETVRGPRITPHWRWLFALGGGMIAGFGARLARGCTSGQGLSGRATRDVYFNSQVNLVMLDVRDEADYNLFHIDGAKRIPLDELEDLAHELKAAPQGTVVVLMSNDETLATQGWKTLVAESVPNVYILEGGLNNCIALCSEQPFTPIPGGDEVLRWEFKAALGGNHPTSKLREQGMDYEYTPKVKIEKAGPVGGGGCG